MLSDTTFDDHWKQAAVGGISPDSLDILGGNLRIVSFEAEK
jgi:hypothetical protein